MFITAYVFKNDFGIALPTVLVAAASVEGNDCQERH